MQLVPVDWTPDLTIAPRDPLALHRLLDADATLVGSEKMIKAYQNATWSSKDVAKFRRY